MELEEFLNIKKNELIALYTNYLTQNNKVATGRTLRSLDIQTFDNGMLVSLPYQIEFIDKGVNGTQTGQGSPFSFTGNYRMIPTADLLPWMNSRGIPESAKYAVATSIYKNGFPGVNQLDNLLTEYSANFFAELGELFEEDIINKIELGFV